MLFRSYAIMLGKGTAMYYSNHNHDVTYFFTYGKPIKVSGKGAVCKEDTNTGKPEGWTREYSRLHLESGITQVKQGFLEAFSDLKELILDRSVENIEMTDELRTMLKKNKVTIRGAYDTYAEEFAEENNLLFIHSDIHIGIRRDEEHYQTRCVTLHFADCGRMELLYEDFCQGISAGNTMGGEFTRKMPDEFCRGCTIKEFAEMMPEVYFDQIMKNEELKAFLDSYAKRGNK